MAVNRPGTRLGTSIEKNPPHLLSGQPFGAQGKNWR